MYENKDQSYYFLSVRDDLIRLIPQTFKECNVLEIGCGNGATLNKLKQLGIAKTTTGVELFSSKDNYYSTIDHFFLENIENILFSDDMQNSFDIIILGDVIEHLVDPWSTLQKIVQLLSPTGRLIASIPNIRYYTTLQSIVWKGDFHYEEAGILDQTHLRFFCKKNIIELFTSAGLNIESLTSAFDQETIKSKKYWLNKITLGIFHDFFVYQYLIVTTKKG
ncbi:MAG: class I SAM-dependent methyltransferase [Campylobacterales bacterium]|nr:class I SAM-dependent methyltransferase [Campylobacterales bacterium]